MTKETIQEAIKLGSEPLPTIEKAKTYDLIQGR